MNDKTNRRILIVDDNEAIHRDFAKILRSGSKPASAGGAAAARAAFFGEATEAATTPPASTRDFDLVSAFQGDEAVELVRRSVEAKQPFAMAFVDVRMPPGMDGVQTIKELWKLDPDLQCVICTAFADYSWDDMVRELGDSDRLLILKKPFDPVEVCQFASALTVKWTVTSESRQNLSAARSAEQESRAYAASLETVNRALETAKATAEAADRAKSEFLANMSHEIRTPMVAILGYADLLGEPEITEKERGEFLGTVKLNGRHLLAILDDILDIARIEAGKLPVCAGACDPAAVARDVVEMLQLRAREKGLDFQLVLEPGLPEKFTSDTTRLRQILVNLTGNALKFTERGSVTVKLRPARGPEGESLVQFEISDTGIGIAKSDIVRLFEAFTQADNSSTRQFGGAGLGLSISRRLAQMLGGDIRVRSTVAQGSTFTLSLPLQSRVGASGELRADGGSSEPASSASSGQDRRPAAPHSFDESPVTSSTPQGALFGRILLVEDFAPTQRLISTLLQRAGAEVTVGSHGKEAVELVLDAMEDGRPHDLVLMDMQMPVLDGYRATERLRNHGYRGPIIALTAHALAGDREKCMDAGCDDYVTKPVDRRQLIEMCRRLMGGQDEPGAPLPGAAARTGDDVGRERASS